MQISGSYQSPLAISRIQFGSLARSQAVQAVSTDGPSLRDFAQSVLELRDAHRALARAGKHYRAFGANSSARAGSSASLSLSTTLSNTTLTSVEEVNTVPTSFGPTSPQFAGSSSADPTIGGQYSGENGDNTLTFTATLGGVVGLSLIRIEVRDEEDNLLDTFSQGFGSSGTVFTLSNGLTFTLSSGNVQLGDSFQVDVSASVGSAVRADNPFNGSGDGGAGFDPGQSVGAGSFEVNGVSIAVNASDTLNAVLSQINGSAAGVTATFDAETESVLLTQNTAGPSNHVSVGNDTSGFLAAVKLDGATEVLGTLDERAELISDVDALSEIQSGNFSINGTTLSLDIFQDSLQDVIQRINDSEAGVTAAFNVSTGRVTLQSNDSQPLLIEDEGTNLFSAFAIAEGTYVGKNSRSRTRFRTGDSFKKQLNEFVKAYEKVFDGTFSGFGAATVNGIRTQLDQGVAEVFSEVAGKTGSGTLRSGVGINFVLSDRSHRTLEFDRGQFAQALKRDAAGLAELLFAESDRGGVDGLSASLEERLDKAITTLGAVLGPEVAGLRLDVSA